MTAKKSAVKTKDRYVYIAGGDTSYEFDSIEAALEDAHEDDYEEVEVYKLVAKYGIKSTVVFTEIK